MALSDRIVTNLVSPLSGSTNAPLLTPISVVFDRVMDHADLQLNFFIEGPDTDQWVGPGLLELTNPDNISQGDLVGFLRSPGYRGILQGSYSFVYLEPDSENEVTPVEPYATTDYRTKLIFTPTQPLHPLLTYTVNITDTKDSDSTLHEGYVVYSFEAGTGSITEIPSITSTSILASSGTTTGTEVGLQMLSSVPADYSINNLSDLSEITITFDKDLDSSTITDDKVIVETFAASDHPNLTSTVRGKLAKQLVVSGKTLTIKI